MSADPEYTVPEGVIPDAPPSVPTQAPPATPSPAPAGASPSDGAPAPYSEGANRRIQELVNERRRIEQAAAQATAQARAEADLYRRQVEALTSTRTPDPEEQQRTAIKAAFYDLFPWSKEFDSLTPEQARKVLASQAASEARLKKIEEAAEEEQKSYYNSVADQTLDTVYGRAKTELYGGRDLTPVQREYVRRAFTAYVELDRQQLHRYINRDTALVSDFIKHFAAEMLDPVRRQAAVNVGARVARTAAAPTGGGSGGPVGTPTPTVPKDEDALHEAAWLAMKGKLGV